MSSRVRVFAPATVANLGPGFDVLGLALERPGDVVEAELVDRPGVEIVQITGDGGALSTDPDRNVAGRAAAELLRKVRLKPDTTGPTEARLKPGTTGMEGGQGLRLWLHKQMPLASGLGSSGASSVGGAVAANELLGRPLANEELLRCAMEGERAAAGSPHADNVAPSLLGGIVLIRSYEPLEIVSLPVPASLWIAVAHPHCELSTAVARAVVNNHQYSIGEAVKNLGNMGALVAALHADDLQLLGRCIEDALVEPLRAPLIPGFTQVKAAALGGGALGCSIAGAGPSVFAL
ncbi:MAG: homoserine kinase, partial [Planctomycetes bacterium]|nr:homoserine kinase [Planctomycetota bacterium]